ncbi:MAG: hypothetical protein HZY74_00835 [Brevundimonas sp.]|nr:MAG: hypothetical protein HZY74_00835 [Brevundimonas sp.]
MVLVDSYALTPSLARAIARKAEQAIFIDDVQALAYPPGYVLHPAPDLAPRQPDEARWLTGPVWQALRRPFREAPNRPSRRPKLRTSWSSWAAPTRPVAVQPSPARWPACCPGQRSAWSVPRHRPSAPPGRALAPCPLKPWRTR